MSLSELGVGEGEKPCWLVAVVVVKTGEAEEGDKIEEGEDTAARSARGARTRRRENERERERTGNEARYIYMLVSSICHVV